MNEMIERVAKAIEDNIAAGLPAGVTVDYRYAACAAIGAMREPTQAMLDAPYAAEIDFGPGGTGDVQADPGNVWAAMIDAALSES